MTNLILNVNINSACNLANVNFFTKMNVYAVVTLTGDNTQRKQEVKTPVDRYGGSNPKWNHTVNFSIDGRLVRDGRWAVDMKLISRSRVLGNKSIGVVNVPVIELLNSVTPSTTGDGNGNAQEMRYVTYPVRSRSGKPKGSLILSYRFNTPTVKQEVPTITYPSPLELGGSSSQPILEIKPYSTPPLEPKIEHPISAVEHDSDDWKYPLSARDSSYDPLLVSYQRGLTNKPYSHSISRKPRQANHHPLSQPSYEYFPPPQIHNGNGPYSHAPPLSPASSEWNEQPNRNGLQQGLGVGLLGGLMMGDIISDVVNAFDI